MSTLLEGLNKQQPNIVTAAEFWNTYKDSGSDLWNQWAGFFGQN